MAVLKWKNPTTNTWERYYGGSGGGTIDVDDAMSDTSTNAVQNKVIKEYIDAHSGNPDMKEITEAEVKDLFNFL